jgi:peptide-methionine (S)-S-oxide reductase
MEIARTGWLALVALAAFFPGPSAHAAPPPPFPSPKTQSVKTEQATFAAGCFWGVEADFHAVPGVLRTTVGYTGGTGENPTYEQVCTGRTGHAEAVLVEFDPSKVTYAKLLDAFWKCHDPTTRDRQGPDVGTQYRSAIFFHGGAQQKAAAESKRKLEETRAFPGPIVTQIVAAGPFYRAEEYHQQYLEKRGQARCPR